MAQAQKKINSVKLDCSECGAEVIYSIIYAPGFKDFDPKCPFCDGVDQEAATSELYAEKVGTPGSGEVAA